MSRHMHEKEDVKDILDAMAEWIDLTARSGMVSYGDLIEQIHDRTEDELGGVDEPMMQKFADRARAAVDAREKLESGWPAVTTNDKIDAAFKELNEAGIIALQGAGYTMSDGWDEANDIAATLATPPRGAVFYHWQDLERGVKGEGLWLAYGAYVEGEGHEQASLAIAAEACEALRRHGVAVTFRGNIEERIFIEPFSWQRRFRAEDPEA
ncbi:MAG: hypothetical protein ACAI38_03175 [Myxococcota bacterium]|nr:hypothetical protein [Myxococcota bacterium]